MVGFGARRSKTRGQLMRDELGSSWEHLMQAATHAANGMGAGVAPVGGKVRAAASRGWSSTSSTLAPLAEAYRIGARDALAVSAKKAKAQQKEKEMSRKRMGLLVGLLAAGAAAGAAGALVMRRRKQQEWAEYDPSEALHAVHAETRSATGKTSERTASAMDKAANSASRTLDKAGDKLHSAASSLNRPGEGLQETAGDMAERASQAANTAADRVSSASKNNRG